MPSPRSKRNALIGSAAHDSHLCHISGPFVKSYSIVWTQECGNLSSSLHWQVPILFCIPVASYFPCYKSRVWQVDGGRAPLVLLPAEGPPRQERGGAGGGEQSDDLRPRDPAQAPRVEQEPVRGHAEETQHRLRLRRRVQVKTKTIYLHPITKASNEGSQRFHNHGEGPY